MDCPENSWFNNSVLEVHDMESLLIFIGLFLAVFVIGKLLLNTIDAMWTWFVVILAIYVFTLPPCNVAFIESHFEDLKMKLMNTVEYVKDYFDRKNE